MILVQQQAEAKDWEEKEVREANIGSQLVDQTSADPLACQDHKRATARKWQEKDALSPTEVSRGHLHLVSPDPLAGKEMVSELTRLEAQL